MDRFLDVLFFSLVPFLAALFFPLPRFLQDGVLALAAAGFWQRRGRPGGLAHPGLGVVQFRAGQNCAPVVEIQLGSGPGGLEGISSWCDLTWRLGWSFVLTLMAWNINFFGSFLIARSLDLPVTFWEVGALVGLSTIFTLRPIFAGLGTREVSLIFLFSQLGLSQEQALAFSFMLLGLVLVHTAIGWLSLILYPPAIRPRDLMFQGDGF